MVHALREIWRVLTPGGLLLDVRPLVGDWPIEVVAHGHVYAVGQVDHKPEGYVDDRAANDAAARAGREGWFIRDREGLFDFAYYWDTPEEMQAYMEEEWGDYLSLSEKAVARAQELIAAAGEGAQVRVRLDMIISRWRKQ